ncbi:MAG: hypothetical protein DPW16_06010 [Chloroflexi bacterium]|nr:hypothetical protein [Chloroflexota bacterium]
MADYVKTGVTLQDLMNLVEDEWVEVSKGELIKLDMGGAGFLHKVVADNLRDILKPFAKQHKLGRVFSDGLIYVLSMLGDTITDSRIPDVSFIREENLRQDFDLELPYPGAPDLAVEVVSPTERADYLQEKIADYRTAGTEQIWVIYPSLKELYVYQRDSSKTIAVYGINDILEAPTLFPGLQIKIADLFSLEGN